MSAEILRRAAEAERAEWGDPTTRRVFPKASAIHLAIARWLEDTASGWIWDEDPEDIHDPDGWPLTLEESMDSHALAVARLILGEAS